MANFGLSRPWIAQYVKKGNYRNAFRCAEAVNTSVKPNYNEASLPGDNREVERINEFKNADVTMGVTRLPRIASKVMFGHDVSDDGTEISNSEDSGEYVGYGFITAEMEDGKKKYRACFLPKVKFSEGEESYETKGDNITFKTPSLNGTAITDTDGQWRIKSPFFDTEEEADKWIQVQVGVMEKCGIPSASVSGGSYEGSQSVTLNTTTTGATIRYTTDGTTPSETNGTVYSKAINISGNTGLRAIAYKEGAQTSDILVEEYFITAG